MVKAGTDTSIVGIEENVTIMRMGTVPVVAVATNKKQSLENE